MDIEDLVQKGPNKRLTSGVYHVAPLSNASIRYKIIGEASEKSIPILFTPGGQSGIPSSRMCIHPTVFMNEDELRKEYVDGISPEPTIARRVITPLVKRYICGCGLITHTLGVMNCSQIKMLEDTLTKLNKNNNNYKYFFLIWDRRNHGGSQLIFRDGDELLPEPVHHSNDLRDLLDYLSIDKIIVSGTSSGARLALTFSTIYPDRVLCMVLMNMTSGELAGRFLAKNYYRQHALNATGNQPPLSSGFTEEFEEIIDFHHSLPKPQAPASMPSNANAISCGFFDCSSNSAPHYGMKEVLKSDHFSNLVAYGDSLQNAVGSSSEREEYLKMIDPQMFARIMHAWADFMETTMMEPVVGVTSSQIKSLTDTSALVIHSFVPEDGLHTREGNLGLARLLPRGEFYGCTSGMHLTSGWQDIFVSFVKRITEANIPQPVRIP